MKRIFLGLAVLMVLGQCGAAPVSGQTERLIRIGLALNQTELSLTLPAGAGVYELVGDNPQPINVSGNQLRCSVAANQLLVNQLRLSNPLLITPGASPLGWNSRTYRGEFLVINSGGRLQLVNRLSLEDYLRGVMTCEISPAWPKAALRAQAIAARSYAWASLSRHQATGFNLCATTHCQVYGGIATEDPRTDQAVADTAAQVLTYQNKVIATFFHDSSGGYTEDPLNIWGLDIPYLKPVPDWDHQSNHFQWTRSLNWSELQTYTIKSYPQVGRLLRLIPTSFDKDGKVLKLALIGDRATVNLTGEQFRYLTGIPSSNLRLGVIYGPAPFITLWWVADRPYPIALMANDEVPELAADLLSPPWDLADPWAWLQDKQPVKVVLKGFGWGHRVGLSQKGAKAMAEAGYSEVQILEHYYPGTTLARITE